MYEIFKFDFKESVKYKIQVIQFEVFSVILSKSLKKILIFELNSEVFEVWLRFKMKYIYIYTY